MSPWSLPIQAEIDLVSQIVREPNDVIYTMLTMPPHRIVIAA
jgi:hypothetical protein